MEVHEEKQSWKATQAAGKVRGEAKGRTAATKPGQTERILSRSGSASVSG